MTLNEQSRRLISLVEVAAMLNIGTRTILDWVAADTFPPPIKLGPKMSRWYEDEVLHWLAMRPKAKSDYQPPVAKRGRGRPRKTA